MARMEIVTGRERRRNWSDEKKLQIVHEAATSGLSVADVARRHDLVAQQIHVWRRQLLAKVKAEANGHGGSARFLPVAVIAEPDQPEAPQDKRAASGEKPKGAARASRIEIRCKGGRVLKVEADLDPAVLRSLIRSVEAA